jgi:hypothetical protein
VLICAAPATHPESAQLSHNGAHLCTNVLDAAKVCLAGDCAIVTMCPSKAATTRPFE